MLKAKLVASLVGLALVGALGGCASAGSGSSTPYAGRHDHQRDAKQGAVPTAPVATSPVPTTRKSLRQVP